MASVVHQRGRLSAYSTYPKERSLRTRFLRDAQVRRAGSREGFEAGVHEIEWQVLLPSGEVQEHLGERGGLLGLFGDDVVRLSRVGGQVVEGAHLAALVEQQRPAVVLHHIAGPHAVAPREDIVVELACLPGQQ